jgi:micrococcal nuclease
MNRRNRKILCIGLCLFLALALSCEATWASEWKEVEWVDDGDTVVLSDGVRVRYIGINAPEVAHEDRPGERFGPEARAFNRKLVYQKKVRLELDREKYDQYKRLLAYVFLEDGTFVNAELIKGGYAHCLFRRPNTRHHELLLGLQKEAMEKRVGLWKEFADQEGPYVGNRHSRRFHRPGCPFGKTTSAKNRVVFKRRYDAFWAGYGPCKRCAP